MMKTITLLFLTLLMTACSLSSGLTQADVVKPEHVSLEIRYETDSASEVVLGWGINGWQSAPEALLSADTFVQDNVLHTPMKLDGNTFMTTIAVPLDATFEYGFLITKDKAGNETAVWDGDYQETAVADATFTITAHTAGTTEEANGDVAAGEQLFSASCAACHGANGQGIPNLGKSLQANSFVDGLGDAELVTFIKNGRSVDDPLNTTGVPMPPNGGNSNLTDQDLNNLVAHLRTLSAGGGNNSPEDGDLWVEAEPTVVAGFSVTPFLQLPEKYPTCLAFKPDGVLYVCTYDGTIWAVADEDGDGIGDEPTVFAEGFQKPVGLLWHEETLFVASAGQITAVRDTNGDGEADTMDEVISGLPAGIYPIHANNDLVLGKDGRLYFGVGATSNFSPETHDHAASILSINLDGTDLQTVATGVRNPYDLAFNANGDLFATDNGPDGDAWINNTPPDELNHIVQDSRYGFPDHFGTAEINSNTVDPIWLFPPHSAPAGIVFYDDDTFPAEYKDNAFVALWTRSQLYRIQLAETAQGEYAAKGTLFASGLTGAVDVVIGTDGNLYVSASETGTIYRITYDK